MLWWVIRIIRVCLLCITEAEASGERARGGRACAA